MRWTEFQKIIETKRNNLLQANKEAMSKGDLNTCQCNCNVLKGMMIVYSLAKKL